MKISQFSTFKKQRRKIVMLTAYDYAMAKIVDESGVDVILVGDSLANVMLGLDSTLEVTTDEMILHAQSVARAVSRCCIIGDMPYKAYQAHPRSAVKNAQRFVHEAGCHAVKIEWFAKAVEVAKNIVASGIPVMGHVGLTPQTAHALGGMKVQGKDAESAKKIISQALALEQAGCFSVVLECVPDRLAQQITRTLTIPTIGIGAGVHCDGQVLVIHDLLGLWDRYHPKFVKTYIALKPLMQRAISEYAREVRAKKFPSDQESFHYHVDG